MRTSRLLRRGSGTRARFRVPATSAMAVAFVLLAGCGSDDQQSDGTPAAPATSAVTTPTAASSVDATVATTGGPAGTAATATAATAATAAPAGEPTGEPIVVGVIGSYSGPFGIYGKPMELALRSRFALDNDAAGNHPIELVFEDDATDPATAVTKATKLVEEDGASVVICCVNGAATLAVGPVLAELGVPQIGPIPNPAGLGEFPSAFVAAPTAGYDAGRVGTYAATTLGYKTAAVLGSDFSYGHEVASAFIKGFTDAGGTILQEQYPALGTTDFGSFLASVPEADVVFGGFAGADGIAFVQQYEQFGLKARVPLIAHGPLVTELLLQQEGPAAAGITAGFYYSSKIENPENTRFMEALFAAKPDLPPSHFTAGAWAAGSVVLAAINSVGDATDDIEALTKAIATSKVEAPWGTLEFDPTTHYAAGTTYIYTVTQSNDALVHQMVTSIP